MLGDGMIIGVNVLVGINVNVAVGVGGIGVTAPQLVRNNTTTRKAVAILLFM